MKERRFQLYKRFLMANIISLTLQGAIIFFRGGNLVWFIGVNFCNVIIAVLLSDKSKSKEDLAALYVVLFVATLSFSIITTLVLAIMGSPIWWMVILSILYITEIAAVLASRGGKKDEW